jgi:AraC-like DNA-binding protein
LTGPTQVLFLPGRIEEDGVRSMRAVAPGRTFVRELRNANDSAQPERDALPADASGVINVRSMRPVGEGAAMPAISLWLVRAVVVVLRERGMCEELPEIANIDLMGLRDPASAISRAQASRLLARIASVTGDRNVLLEVGRSVTDAHFHFLGPLLMSQVTARKTLELMFGLCRTLLGGPSWSLELRGERASVGHPPWIEDPTGARLEAELDMSLAYHAARRYWGPWVTPLLQVELSCDDGGDAAPYRRYLGQNVRFGAKRSALSFPAELLDYVRPAADSELAARLTDYAREKYMRAGEDSSWVERVERVLRAADDATGLELPEVARRCRVSTRTLRRRLAEEHTTFSEIRARVRIERAAALLVTTDQSTSAISSLLGYADANSFRRAFQRWAGRTPAQYRVARGWPGFDPET